MALPFTKVEGLGNDFVVVDLRPGRPAAASAGPSPEDPAVVRALCDRRFGVGGDGVLAILPSQVGDARMRVLNADGSEAEMCGNGIRCVAKLLYDTDPAMRRPTLRIETGAGVLACDLDVEAGRVRTVAVEMGRPRLTRDEIPIRPGGATRVLRESITARDRTFQLTG
jgi:diaminopimelate epimerase